MERPKFDSPLSVKTTHKLKLSEPKDKGKFKRLLEIKLSLPENDPSIFDINQEMRGLLVPKWACSVDNIAPVVGRNDMLDKYLAGSTYTAAWYAGLINDSAFTGFDDADTSASHAGWTEDTNYSEANRQTISWSAASSGVKSSSADVSFTFNASTTIKGTFIISDNTKGGSTGIIFSEVYLSSGDRSAVNLDVLDIGFDVVLTG